MYIMLLTIRLAQIPIHEEVFLKEDWLRVQAYPFPRQLRLAVCHLGAGNIHASTNRVMWGIFAMSELFAMFGNSHIRWLRSRAGGAIQIQRESLNN